MADGGAAWSSARQKGYWLTGDVAYRDEARRFYQMDRIADVIETDAGPVYSVLTEEIQPLLAGLKLAEPGAFPVGVTGKVLKRVLGQRYAHENPQP
jgi:hypothetical protein